MSAIAADITLETARAPVRKVTATSARSFRLGNETWQFRVGVAYLAFRLGPTRLNSVLMRSIYGTIPVSRP